MKNRDDDLISKISKSQRYTPVLTLTVKDQTFAYRYGTPIKSHRATNVALTIVQKFSPTV